MILLPAITPQNVSFLRPVQRLQPLASSFTSQIALSNEMLVALGSNGLSMWSLDDRTEHILDLHGNVPIIRQAFIRDGKPYSLMSDPMKGTVGIMDVLTGQMVEAKQPGLKINGWTVSPDGHWLAVINFGSLHVINTETGETQFSHQSLPGVVPSIYFMPAFSGDSSLVSAYLLYAPGCNCNEVIVWESRTGIEVCRFQTNLSFLLPWSIKLSDDGSLLAVGYGTGTDIETMENGIIKVWSVETGSEIGTIPTEKWTAELRFSPDNRYISMRNGKTLRVWNLQTAVAGGKPLIDLQINEQEQQAITSMDFSPDGRLLAVGSTFANDLLIFDVATGTQLAQFDGHQSMIEDMQFSDDGRLLATSSYDGIVLWSVGA